MTFTEIVAEICDKLNYTNSDDLTRVGKLVNSAYKTVTSSIGIQLSRRTTVQETATIGVSTVTFSDTEKIFNVYNRAVSPYKKLDEVTDEEIKGMMPFVTGDLPTKWARTSWDSDDVVIIINCVPQTAIVLYADVIQTAATLSGTNEPAFPESFHKILVNLVLVEEYEKIEKLQLSIRAEQKAEKMLSDLRMWSATAAHLDLYQNKLNEGLFGRGGSGGGSGSSFTGGALSWTQTGLITFDRDPSFPFAVTSGSAKVDNLDADMVDGVHITDIASTEILLGTSASNVGSTPALTFDTSSGAQVLEVSGVDSISLGASELGGGFLTCTGTLTIATFTSPGATFTTTTPIILDAGGASPEILASNHNLTLASNTDVIVQLDKNANTANSAFTVKDGVGGTVLRCEEAKVFYLSNNTTARVFIGDSANDFNVGGVTVNQGTEDGEILSFKSSDIAHGTTSVTETDTYGLFKKDSATAGGLLIRGLREDNGTAISMYGSIVGAGDTTKSTAAIGALVFSGSEQSGTTIAAMSANTNIAVFQSLSTTRFILDADGDSHQDVGTAWTNFDHIDDLKALDAIALSLAKPEDELRLSFVESLTESKDFIESIPGKPIVTFNEDGNHFANMSRVTMLHHGAIRFLARQNQELLAELAEVKQKLLN